MAGNPFSNLFGQSPIRPIQTHMARVHECAEQLIPFIEASLQDDWATAKQIRSNISKLEGKADKIKKDLRLNLPKNLLMPVHRSDMLDLIGRQDKIANCTKDISGIMMGRKMVIPEAMAEIILEYAETAVATSAQALKAINEMDELLSTGFRGRELVLVEGLIEELDDLENKNDKLQIAVRAKLFKLESKLSPIDVMFLYRIIDGIGELADRAQKVGSRMQLLIAS
ncbi:MAG: TIGR00153 family protein [Cellvibrionales bacterium]|jgi:predicted phosphate transport protein (TIGR00153 family)|nr:TIGR00153 family protein [Cellvibrionales bacterium]MBT5923228.1 TIGR00153 family protein [Cellvibrionales bacterium]MBT6580013.1 TIGR00153 family protein [Cellvibrionales bacterium]